MPKFYFPHNLYPPDPPDVCELAVFPVAVVPYVLGALESRATAYTWSQDGYLRGVQLIRSMQMAVLCGGMQELLESNNRLYRMLDTTFYGTPYSVVTSDPLLVEPALQPVHDLTIVDPASIFGRMEDMRQLLQNALNGTETPNYSDTPGIRELLANLIAAFEAGEANDEEMLAKLVQIAGLLV